ncbi:pseudouridine synthase, partial [Aeromonas dhakensis]
MYRILAQHKDFMVINKGPGLGMHDETDEAGLLHPGLVSRVKADTGLLLYPVHRLDKMTSGLVLLARTTEANRALSMAFAAREVSKQYLALSDRKPKKKQGWVKGDMQKGRGGSWMLTRTLDNPAISWFDSVSVREGLRLYRIKPQTGKTHQIRVALKSVGAPILGDER